MTFTRKVTLTIASLTTGLFLVFIWGALFVAFSVEDAIIHRVIEKAKADYDKTQILPIGLEKKSIADLADYNFELTEPEIMAGFREFKSNGRQYHLLITGPDSILLLDSTELAIMNLRLEGILKFLLYLFIPSLLLSYYLATRIARRALRPFLNLKSLFLDDSVDIKRLEASIETIKETDVKMIADELFDAISTKERALYHEILFNQGMSHELRTPLQVMIHSVEYLATIQPELTHENSYNRLMKSIGRMNRISESMLWLTTEKEFDKKTNINQIVDGMSHGIQDTLSGHQIQLDTKSEGDLFIAIPSEVFEFILYNLFNNVIQHAATTDGAKMLHIHITQDLIEFTNTIDERNEESQINFGLGLVLIEKLCSRFHLSMSFNTSHEQFSVTIAK